MTSTPILKQRNDIHLARKIWHFVGVIFITVIYHNLERSLALQTLILVSAFSIFVDVYRQRSEKFNEIVISIGRHIMRENEIKGIAGVTYMLIGVLVIVAIFPPSVVTLSLLFLAFADPIASYFGIRYGKDRLIGRKSLQGSAAAFIACTIVAAIYFYAHDLMTERIVVVSIIAGLIGAIAEATPVGNLDDNLVLPVVSSCLLWIVYFFFGGF